MTQEYQWGRTLKSTGVGAREKTTVQPKGLQGFVCWPLASLVNFLGIWIRQECLKNTWIQSATQVQRHPTKEAMLTTGLLFFFPLSPSTMDWQGKYLTDYKERPVSASLISTVRKHSCLSLARLPLIWGGTEIPKWGQRTKICVLPAKQ